MKLAMQPLVAILIASATLCSNPSSSIAAPARPAVRITNNTARNITYEFRWGGSSNWKAHVIRPGETDTHSRGYDPKGVLPADIRFVPASGSGEYKTRQLDWGWENRVPGYSFIRSRNKIDLTRD